MVRGPVSPSCRDSTTSCDDNHRVAAVRAELAERAGDIDLARASYRMAIDLCANEVERAHLRARLAEIEALDR